jgi:hypothetical protein
MSYWLIAVATVLSGTADTVPTLESQTFAKLEGVELSATQTTRIKALVRDFGPRIAALEPAAAPTQSQREDRASAVQRAVAQGKRGVDARRIIAPSGELTAAQKSAARQLARLHHELDRAAWAILTDSQQATLLQSSPVVAKATAPAWSGFIIVRLSADVTRLTNDCLTLEDVARAAKLPQLHQLLVEFQLTGSSRAVRLLRNSLLVPPAQQAETQALMRRVESYWRIDVRGSDDSVDRVVERLGELPFIDSAYRERAPTEPAAATFIDPSSNPYFGRQGYLEPAPEGIDAYHAWTRPNARGAHVGIVDVELSWNVEHEDLAAQGPVLVHGHNRPGSDHGTGVLGEVLAEDNRVGVVGAAPSAAYVFLSSWYDPGTTPHHLGKAIVEVLPLMHPGDVLLIAADRSGIPVEVDDVDFDAIKLAVATGVIVIEAAGNGGVDLDRHKNPLGKLIFNRNSPDYRDSGAIVVGAADPRDSRNRMRFSCYGSRIDCFAWGGYVTTCGFGDLDAGHGDPDKTYTKKFNGTSSAAPIVAGAAMILQGMARANSGQWIPPRLMRTLLANRRTGTPQGPRVTGAIGVMPDLKAIIQANPSLLLGQPKTNYQYVYQCIYTPRPQRFWGARGGLRIVNSQPLGGCFCSFRR